MEFISGGDLYQMIKKKKKMNEKNSSILLKNVAEALDHIHKLMIIIL
jgi:serine/threonine protein kinase